MTSSGRRSRDRCGCSAGARVPRASARRRVARGGRGLLRGHGFACGPTAAASRLPTAARSAKPAPSPPACRGRHVWRAAAHGTCAQRLHALRSRDCGSGLGASGVRDGGVGRPTASRWTWESALPTPASPSLRRDSSGLASQMDLRPSGAGFSFPGGPPRLSQRTPHEP